MKNIIIFQSLSIIYCIILPTIKLKQNKHYIKVFIGTPPQKFNLLFDLGSSDFWIYDKESNESKFNNGFNKNNSITFQKIGYNKEINYLGGYASGLMCLDILKLGENTINNFTFLLINETNIENKMDGIVGCNKNLSFIDQLYNNKIINKKILVSDLFNNKVYFGEIPHYLIGNDNISFINNNKRDWKLSIDNMIINNISYDFSENITEFIIDSGVNGIIFTFSTFEFLREHLFNKVFEKGICKIMTLLFGLTSMQFQIQCDERIINEKAFLLNNITLLICNDYLNITLESLLDKQSFNFDIYFVQSVFYNIWIIGAQFLEEHPIIFDKDNNIITIYKSNVQLNAENYLKFRLVINTFIKITIFLLILLIIIVSCYLINQTRTSQKINQNVIEKKILKYTSFV